MELRYDSVRLRASTLGEARRYLSQRISYDSVRGAQGISFLLFPGMTLSANGEQGRFDYDRPKRQTRLFSGLGRATYVLNASLYVDASGAVRVLKDSLVPTEQTIEATLRLRWTVRKLEVDPTLQFIDQQRGNTSTTELRFLLSTIRRF